MHPRKVAINAYPIFTIFETAFLADQTATFPDPTAFFPDRCFQWCFRRALKTSDMFNWAEHRPG